MKPETASPHIAEAVISRAIVENYLRKLSESLVSDVIVTGAGPAGLEAAYRLAKEGWRVVVLERRLAPGGGTWGGAMGMNVAIVQNEAKHILDAHEIDSERCGDGLLAVNAVELAAALIRDAVKAGVSVFNLMRVEDVCVHADRVDGIVANGGTIPENLPVDPVVFTAPCVVDATGHDAFVVQCLRRRGLLDKGASGEFPMNAAEGERFVVEHTGEIHPGLWIADMSVCSVHGGPRMGPIFGGMLLSGARIAGQIMEFFRTRRE